MSMWLAEVDGETCAALRRLVGDNDELYEKVRTLFNASWFRSLALVKDAYEKRNSSVSWRHAIEKGEAADIPPIFFDKFIEMMKWSSDTPAVPPPAAVPAKIPRRPRASRRARAPLRPSVARAPKTQSAHPTQIGPRSRSRDPSELLGELGNL